MSLLYFRNTLLSSLLNSYIKKTVHRQDLASKFHERYHNGASVAVIPNKFVIKMLICMDLLKCAANSSPVVLLSVLTKPSKSLQI